MCRPSEHEREAYGGHQRPHLIFRVQWTLPTRPRRGHFFVLVVPVEETVTPAQIKAALRRQALERIAAAPATTAEAVAIQERIIALDAFGTSRVISRFVPLPGAPAAELLCEQASDKTICCPAMGPNGPELRVVRTPVEMKRTPRGFFEPPEGASIDPSLVDFFVVPGLAFDLTGWRLGRGGGYYDRLLARRRSDATTVGLVPDRLLVTELPREPHDIAMTHVSTEARLLTVAPEASSEPIGKPNGESIGETLARK